MKKIITIVIIIIVTITIFFIKTNYKLFKFGNNISNKSADKIEKYILDINSYEVKATITVESNKNSNTYIIKEKCLVDDNAFEQELLEPENLNGVSFKYDGKNLKIENSKLNLNKIYENYPYIGENTITLIGFIKDYTNSDKSSMIEKEGEIILETKLKGSNKYICYKKLYINKNTGEPTKLEIQDITQKTTIYILYNEIKINNLQKDDVIGFKVKMFTNDV